MSRKHPPKTVASFLKELEASNKSLADWARENELSLDAVYSVTRGRSAGKRGDSRKALIAMGVTPPSMFRAASTASA
jgi:gp16 family phage-associated protein